MPSSSSRSLKPPDVIGLAFAYLRDRALTTILNILLLALSVATLVLLLSFSTQLGDRFERDAEGIDLVVGAKGSPLQLVLSSVYHLDVPTGNVPLDSLDMLRRDRSVARAVPLALGDSFRGYRIVGTEPAYLDLYGARLARGRIFGGSGDAVLGADAARVLGAGLGQRFVGSHGLSAEEGAGEHADHPFTTVGILAPTGTVIDRLILTPIETVWDVHGIEHQNGEAHGGGAPHAHEEPEGAALADDPSELQPEVTAILVTYRSVFGAVRLPNLINRQTNMQAASPAVETARLLGLVGAGVEGARLFAWLLALIGGASIFIALLNAARAREADLALLRVVGAGRAAVFGTILLEGLIIAVVGAALGLLAGHLALAAGLSSFYQLQEAGIDAWRFHPGELLIALAVLAIGALAALIPALRVYRIDLARTLARAS